MRDTSTNAETGEFRIDEDSPGPATKVLVVHGDADLHSAPELRERLHGAIEQGATSVVVDLTATALVDSTSLGVLLGGMKRLSEQDGDIRLVVPTPEVRRVFEITMLDRIFPLYDTRAEALTAPAGEAG